jgi:hypothetical protein
MDAKQAKDPWMAPARSLAKVMDHHHLDPILGFVLPGVGDVLGGFLGLYIIGLAWRRKVPKITLARMVINTAIDTGVGVIPIFGDIFDYYFHANTRNLALLERPGDGRGHAVRDGFILALALCCLLVALSAPVVLVVYVVHKLWTGHTAV